MPNQTIYGVDSGGTARAVLVDSTGALAVGGGGTAAPATVGGITRVRRATLTRPGDTATYAAGDVIANSTSAPVPITFTGAARVANGSGVIVGVTLTDNFNQSTTLSAELWLFAGTAAPTIANDNAAFTPGTADLANIVGVVPFTTSYNGAGTAGSGASGNRVFVASNLNIPFEAGAGTADLWGVLVARNAYVPGSAEVFGPALRILQD